MPLALHNICENNQIEVHYYSFTTKITALYIPGPPHTIILANKLTRSTERTYLAEEIGHYYTSPSPGVESLDSSYYKKLHVSKYEARAKRYAALCLIPIDDLEDAFEIGITEKWELAECFEVEEWLVELRLRLYEIGL